MKQILDLHRINHTTHPKLPGIPDFIIPEAKIVIFVDGDFWHGRDPKQIEKWKKEAKELEKQDKYEEADKKNRWIHRIQKTKRHDQAINHKLELMGYKVRRIWATDLMKYMEKTE